MKQPTDQIVDYVVIETCPECEWKHEGDEEKHGTEVFINRMNMKYWICPMTNKKVFI